MTRNKIVVQIMINGLLFHDLTQTAMFGDTLTVCLNQPIVIDIGGKPGLLQLPDGTQYRIGEEYNPVPACKYCISPDRHSHG